MRDRLARCLWHTARSFVAFFGVIADTLHDVLGAECTDEIDAAWGKLLVEIEQIVSRQLAQ